MTAATKDTIYIDAEDEITAIIDKVINAKHKIVALVLPKRATVFQSPVNMKLLQKAAKNANKSLVLITSDKGILAISAAVGVHVAKTLQSKPAIPTIEKPTSAENEDSSKSSDEAIELDNTDGEVAAEAVVSTKKSKKLMKIPDFTSFRFKVGIAIAAVITLGVLWYVGFVVMPKATVTINTDTSTTSINAPATLKVGQSELDIENNIIPAERVQVEKVEKTSVAATGQKNIGQKATGTLTLTNCIKDADDKVIAAGTRFTKDGKTFVTAEQVILGPAAYVGNNCISADFPGLGAQKNVDAIAEASGEDFNVSEGTFDSSISGIRAYGSDMTGGSTQIVKVISQEDVDKAEQELKGNIRNSALSELRTQLESSGKYVIEETLSEGEPAVRATPAIGEESETVEVTITVSYSLQGASPDDISAILDNEIKKNMGEQQKNIKDNGLDAVVFEIVNRLNEAETEVALQTVATLGPEIDEQALKEDIAGKKRGDIEKQIEAIDGVRSVSVEYSPAWITTTPKSAEKITIVFNESDGN